MKKIDKLLLVRKIIDELIEAQQQRKFTEQQEYESLKARFNCVAAKSCKFLPVKGKTLCEYHLRKANNRRRENYAKK